jgi:hypothetical protein
MAEKTANNGGTENERSRLLSVLSPFLCFSVVSGYLRMLRSLENAVLARYDHVENDIVRSL